ncbi:MULTISPECIES: restriction endonuclease subunit S [Serratia]|uniref:restriction endonuclease subunit S n=1 Tax=Serratia TaxID=613 RepID=UPI0021ADF195|nr:MULTISPECIES: restriction endonuclease subunit S [Serratia]MDM1780184.1 restriction endonuclease subunit S [Serratia marcescens]
MSGGKLPEGWVTEKLNELAKVITKGTTPTTLGFEYLSQGIPFIKVENIDDFGLNFSSVYQYISEEGHLALKRSQFEENDVLFSIAGTIGKTAIVKNQHIPANTNQAVAIIRGADDIIAPAYLCQQLKLNAYKIFKENARGGAMNNVSLGDLKSVEIKFPNLLEQSIIIKKLDTLLAQVDSTKARLEQIPQILKRFRQAVLTVAMSGELTEEWRKNNSILFSSWVNSNIGELAQVATGKTPKRTEVKYWENGSIPWLTSSSTGENYTEVAEQFITPIALKECTLKIFSPGTLLLAMYGEGKTRGQVTELKINAACNQACAAIICDKERIDLQFLKMRLIENYQETRKAAAGGNQPNLNLNKVREIPVIVPQLPEQAEIVRRVEQLFAYADTIEKQVNNALARVNSLTQSILAKAFRGELTAQWRAENPDLISGENSAAALLEKIKAERAASGGKKASRKKA